MLEYVILGCLRDKSASGYQIKKDIEEGAANVWSVSFGGLYAAIDRLKDKEMIEIIEEKENGKVYAITEKGRRHFADWLMKPVSKIKIKDEFMLKLLFASNGELVHILPQIEKKKAEVDETIAFMDSMKDIIPDFPSFGSWYNFAMGTGSLKVQSETLAQLIEKIKTFAMEKNR